MAEAGTSYSELLEWLLAARTRGMKLGLDNTRRLLQQLGNPHQRLHFLHVAGTNGKGSTCALMDAILLQHGYHTGLFTSPHIVDFRERIRVSGSMASSKLTTEVLLELKRATDDWSVKPTFFELSTVLAIELFARAEVDFAILETGMGGRLDSTNVVTPLACSITRIGIDHCRWLGDTLQQIAGEKAGIMKPGVPVVSHPQEQSVLNVLSATAKKLKCPFTVPTHPWPHSLPTLPGEHQQWNAAVAVATLTAAGIKLENKHIPGALAQVHWPGRFHQITDWLVMDAAHNPQAAAALAATWQSTFGQTKCTLLFGVLADKDAVAIFQLLKPIVAELVITAIPASRGRTAAALAAELAPYYPAAQTQVHENLKSAVAAAKNSNNIVLAAGSLYLIGNLMELLKLQPD